MTNMSISNAGLTFYEKENDAATVLKIQPIEVVNSDVSSKGFFIGNDYISIKMFNTASTELVAYPTVWVSNAFSIESPMTQ